MDFTMTCSYMHITYFGHNNSSIILSQSLFLLKIILIYYLKMHIFIYHILIISILHYLSPFPLSAPYPTFFPTSNPLLYFKRKWLLFLLPHSCSWLCGLGACLLFQLPGLFLASSSRIWGLSAVSKPVFLWESKVRGFLLWHHPGITSNTIKSNNRPV